jgi:porin
MRPEPVEARPEPGGRGPEGEVAAGEAAGEQAAEPRWWERDRLTGDWWGGRTWLEERGVDVNGSFTLEWWSVWAGGVRNVASTRTVVDVNVRFDLERLAGWTGGSAFVDAYSTDGRGQGDVGDFQGASYIETDENDDQIGEVWVQQVAWDGRLRVKAGKIDAASEFGFVDAAGGFSNASSGYSPTIVGLPSYPDPAFGVVGQVMLEGDWSLSVGGFDGAGAADGVRTGGHGVRTLVSDDLSDDWWVVAEAGKAWAVGGDARRRGRAAVGVAWHSGRFDRIGAEPDAEGNVATAAGLGSVYGLAEQRVAAWGEGNGGEDGPGPGLDVFAQVGWAEDDAAEAVVHAGVGARVVGPMASRPEDMTGVYVSWVDLNDDGFVEDETVIEVFYSIAVTGSIRVKPDVQVIFNPGGYDDLDTAVVGALLVEVAF